LLAASEVVEQSDLSLCIRFLFLKGLVMLSSAVLILATVVGQADMTSTAEEFQEFGELIVGR
jgi:hypothetical protein